MINIILAGCNGYMGRVVTKVAQADDEIRITAGVDINTDFQQDYPVYSSFYSSNSGTAPCRCNGISIQEPGDVIIDFSNPSALEPMILYAEGNKIPLVLCTTGYNESQNDLIKNASKSIPIFKSGNMSLGINLLAQLVRRACAFLGDEYDIEIVEKHHRRKVDAPSGTALLLADAAASALTYNPTYVYDRSEHKKPREQTDIGISSLRGGTIVGSHEVIFAGNDEVIEIKHSAASRDIFAVGAIKAAKFIAKIQKPAMYDMSDMLIC